MAEVFHRDTDEFDVLLGINKEDTVGFTLDFAIEQERDSNTTDLNEDHKE